MRLSPGLKYHGPLPLCIVFVVRQLVAFCPRQEDMDVASAINQEKGEREQKGLVRTEGGLRQLHFYRHKMK